ncbi:hypothetical protein VTK73DRAFT_3317 [Phialemonium thermophilum]|uniref:Kinase n=1 Tax=Phialemonium thermophilum TaxID=223376 RepID=A0ABR3Y1Q9_9PEZI
MSNHPVQPENAATVAPVSPERPVDLPSGQAASSSPPSPSPSPPHPSAAAPPAGSDAHLPPVHQTAPASSYTPQPSPPQPPLAPQRRPSPTNHADKHKWVRGPVPLPRSPGPSLLTQALSAARENSSSSGNPEPPQSATSLALDSASNLSHPPSAPPRVLSSDDPASSQSPTGAHAIRHAYEDPDASPHHSDGDSLTPRGSPRPAPAMASSALAPLPHPSLPSGSSTSGPYTPKMLDLQEVSSMLRGSTGFYSKANAPISTTLMDAGERKITKQNIPLRRAQTFSNLSGESREKDAVSPAAAGSSLERTNGQRGDAYEGDPTAREALGPSRPRKLDHRVSMGPEKAWSIGAGESSLSQDGQVEKSITEVLAGVEPNVRSRKASHSLRFFKEGLPEEQGRRKETRVGSHTREKLSPLAERPGEGGRQGALDDMTRNDVQAVRSRDGSQSPSLRRQTSSHTSAAAKTPATFVGESPNDYFSFGAKLAEASSEKVQPDPRAPHVQAGDGRETGEGPVTQQEGVDHPEGRRQLSGDTEVELQEDGDDSGEEKISSAVFLPHQRLDELPESPVERSAGLGAAARRTDDFHPWLVKADEPESDKETHDRPELSATPVDESSITVKEPKHGAGNEVSVDEPEAGHLPYEEHVHEHQLSAKEPLEAIELIPYKHQVGGHTTLWRFSKRAVCKQLNNRENEFYERVEKYHRDLLAFLPRYIGVLNVTFQKRSRRRSTVRRDDPVSQERKQSEQGQEGVALKSHDSTVQGESAHSSVEVPRSDEGQRRVISQSLQSTQIPVPTVTFVDNQHILPRNLLQPAPVGSPDLARRLRGMSASSGRGVQGLSRANSVTENGSGPAQRPSLEDRHANSWGATTVNKRLRNEVFNDAFLKQPIAIHRRRRGHQRPLHRMSLHNGMHSQPVLSTKGAAGEGEHSHDRPDAQQRLRGISENGSATADPAQLRQTQSDVGFSPDQFATAQEVVKDVTGTSAPEPEIPLASPPSLRRKRRHSGSGLRRKPAGVAESRGQLVYFQEADEAYKGDNEQSTASVSRDELNHETPHAQDSHEGAMSSPHAHGDSEAPSALSHSAFTSGSTSPVAEFKKIPRPVNPKEAQTQRDSRVQYFLLLEDLTAGMKRPCIMDLKMGTRQYGVDANPKKQKSQQGKCAKTTSRQLGVRVCGLQVWDVKSQSYIFKDKYYGRDLKAGREFQEALTRFLYDGVDPSSILRHIPTVLRKIDELEVIIRRLRGYRFYAASLLMFYDGDLSDDAYDTAVEDSTTDFPTDTEEGLHRYSRKNKREIDFKIADFANSVTAGDLARDKPCPPRHPDEPDRGFLRGLRSLRKYFLKIQRDTRAELGLATRGRNGVKDDIDLSVSDDDSVSE